MCVCGNGAQQSSSAASHSTARRVDTIAALEQTKGFIMLNRLYYSIGGSLYHIYHERGGGHVPVLPLEIRAAAESS